MSETKQNHTPTPWKVETRSVACSHCVKSGATEVAIIGADEDVVALSSPHDSFGPDDANAAFIVRACNSHDELLDALSDVYADITAPMGHSGIRIRATTLDKVRNAIEAARRNAEASR